MNIGLPKEVKDQEFRVGLTPAAVASLCRQGHQVVVEEGAGVGAGFEDAEYRQAGASLVTDPTIVWNQDMVVKVKEPQPWEYDFFRPNLILFTYLHLAAEPKLTEALVTSGITALAYETVTTADGRLPLLTPMSVIAGRLSVQFGARYLERQQGGRGVLLGGIPGVSPGTVLILGGGVVGTEAAKMAVGMGARVQIVDINLDQLAYLETLFGSRVELLYSSPSQIEALVSQADLLIGAVLIPGRKTPTLVSKPMVATMRPGSVIIDVAVDQGGCIETLRPTSHSQPTYIESGVLHFGVPNMPGAVPWTATQALSNATLPYITKLANQGLVDALDADNGLRGGLNVAEGKLVHPAVQQVFPEFIHPK